MCGLLIAVASLVVEHRHVGFSSCGARAQLLRGMWDLPRPGLEPVSPALAGGFSTTAPPRKSPQMLILNMASKDLQDAAAANISSSSCFSSLSVLWLP